MFRLISVLPVMLAASLPLPVAADEAMHGKVHFESCLDAAMQRQPGMVIKVEMKQERGAPVYEFNIRDKEARDWDVECHADTGEIIEVEREVTTPLHPDFQVNLQFDESTARERALAEYEGDIVEAEYEIEADGRAVYEFDIRQPDGTEMKIEIDAATGEVHEANREFWQIGYE